ncbi:MAG: hypothetical protein K8J09_19740 [Planctomycetes bacterium]|nr:hypothetical protein [Planctomycetota bacterium]
MPYFAYDVRGIQSFIFAVPKLRSIIGGSALIDRFDRETVPEMAANRGWDLVHSGGGRGVFHFEDAATARDLTATLVAETRRIGLDLRIGRAERVVDAAHCAEELHPFVPTDMDGHPCHASGLYPVDQPGKVHPVIQRRHFDRGDRMDRWFESIVLEGRDGRAPLTVHPDLREPLTFFREISGDDEIGSAAGVAGLHALGGQRRWAVICMDGNDIGRQFERVSRAGLSESRMLDWVRAAGSAIDDCGTSAFRAGTQRVLSEWIGDVGPRGVPIVDGDAVLPLRPLVLGGDDLALLCHPSYAAAFVLEASRVFTETSERHAKRHSGELWPATDGLLTISAGILFAPASLPLASAIPYTESLLAMAKRRGRDAGAGAASACIDWESITETMLDRPDFRRRRELVFCDADLGGDEVVLTQRPFRMNAFEDLLMRARRLTESTPVSVLHRLLPGLRAAASDRQIFINRLRKNHPGIADALREPLTGGAAAKDFGSSWKLEKMPDGRARRSTDMLDVVGLAMEQRRGSKEVTR